MLMQALLSQHPPSPLHKGEKKLSVICVPSSNPQLTTQNSKNHDQKRTHTENHPFAGNHPHRHRHHFGHHLVHKFDAIGQNVAKIYHSPHLPLSIYNKVYKTSGRQASDRLRTTKKRPTEACEHDFELFFKKNLRMFWRFKKKLYLCTRNRETNLGYKNKCGNSSVGRA